MLGIGAISLGGAGLLLSTLGANTEVPTSLEAVAPSQKLVFRLALPGQPHRPESPNASVQDEVGESENLFSNLDRLTRPGEGNREETAPEPRPVTPLDSSLDGESGSFSLTNQADTSNSGQGLGANLTVALPTSTGQVGPTNSARQSSDQVNPAVDSPSVRVVKATIKSGESLYHIFKRESLSQSDLQAIAGRKGAAKSLRKLTPGQQLEVVAQPDGRVVALIFHQTKSTRVVVHKGEHGFQANSEEGPADQPPLAHPTIVKAIKDAPRAEDAVSDVARVTNPAPEKVESEAVKNDEPIADESTRKSGRLVPIQTGDSLYSLFQAQGVSTGDLAILLKTKPGASSLKQIRPGQSLELFLGDQNSLERLHYHLGPEITLEYWRTSTGKFKYQKVRHPLKAREIAKNGTIESSLFLAGERAGLSPRIIMQMVKIFGWDVDFALDIRAGDKFSLLYEELYKDGKKIRDGNILAAEFVNRGRAIRALRYEHDDGYVQYFTPDGMGMRKAFLRTPVNFTRISSKFSLSRKHPILHKFRAHKGVDYAAARGTPVRAAGDGKVVFAGRKGGYGKTLVLQHRSKYSTLYAHLDGFAKNIRKGRRVEQGQVIGYVGSTGLATGPHLHYEFRVAGAHRDPLKVKLPKSAPIADEYRRDFLKRTAPMLAKLERMSEVTTIASRSRNN